MSDEFEVASIDDISHDLIESQRDREPILYAIDKYLDPSCDIWGSLDELSYLDDDLWYDTHEQKYDDEDKYHIEESNDNIGIVIPESELGCFAPLGMDAPCMDAECEPCTYLEKEIRKKEGDKK